MLTAEKVPQKKHDNSFNNLRQFITILDKDTEKGKPPKPYDVVLNTELTRVDRVDMGSYEAMEDNKNHAVAKVRIGFAVTDDDPYTLITIRNAKLPSGEYSKAAKQALAQLEGNCYGEVDGTTLNLIVLGRISRNAEFKNIGVSYSFSNAVVPWSANPIIYPSNDLTSTSRLEHLMISHYRLNSQIDDHPKEYPLHYRKGQYGPKLLPAVLADTLLKQMDWIECQKEVYVREKPLNSIYHRVNKKDIEQLIMEYLSPQYVTPRHIDEVRKMLLMKVPTDNGLTDPSRLNGKVNFQNGVLNVETGEFNHYLSVPDYKPVFALSAAYMPGATCPTFLRYIQQALPDKADIDIVQEMMGYLLTTDNKAQKAFFLLGQGRTGKSVLIHLIERLIGKDYVSNVPFQELGSKFTTARLTGKLLNSSSDLPQDKIKDTGIFKALVSGDSTHIEQKFEAGFDFNNSARFLFATNQLPRNSIDHTTAFYRRLLIIPFNNLIPENEIDRHLSDKLYAERNGIVQWAIQGLKRLIDRNYCFTESEGSKRLLDDYKKTNDSVLWFADEFCSLDLTAVTASKTLYQAYEKACSASGIVPESQREMNSRLEVFFQAKGVVKRQGSQSRAAEFHGLKLKNQ